MQGLRPLLETNVQDSVHRSERRIWNATRVPYGACRIWVRVSPTAGPGPVAAKPLRNAWTMRRPDTSSERREVLVAVADRVPRPRGREAARVAVDGVDGAGKSVFGDELANLLVERGLTVIRASVDDFHRPRADRYRRGRTSPQGYWLDSFD